MFLSRHLILMFAAVSPLPFSVAFAAPVAETSSAGAAIVSSQAIEDKEDISEEQAGGSGTYLSGRFARVTGDRENAIHYIEEARTADPDDVKLTGQLLVLYLSAGDMDKAIDAARRLSGKTGHDKIVDLLMAVDAISASDYAAARKSFAGAYGTQGGAVWMPLLNAWLSLGKDELKKPLQPTDVLPKGQTKAPSFLSYHLAMINDLAGFDKAAEKQYEIALLDYQKAPFRAVEAAAYFYARHGETEKLTQVKMDYLNAHPLMSALVDNDASSQWTALMAQDGSGEKKRLVENVQEGIAEVMFTMASVIYSVDAAQDAELYLRMALRLRPDFPLAQLLLGNILESDARYADAAKVYDGISPQSPLFSRALLRKATAIERQGHLDEAIAMLDGRIKEYPDEIDTYIAKGDLLRSRSRFMDAAAAYSQALARIENPGAQHWGLYFARGACYERANEWQKGEADLRKALEMNPDQPEVLNYLGYSLLVQDNAPEEARSLIEKAYSLQPDSPHIMDSLGWAYYKNGDIDEAVKMLEQAIEFMPGDPTVNDHLGDAYWQAGRKTEARYQWQRALTYKPDPGQETAINRKLKDGLPPIAVKTTDKQVQASGASPEPQVN